MIGVVPSAGTNNVSTQHLRVNGHYYLLLLVKTQDVEDLIAELGLEGQSAIVMCRRFLL